MPSSRLAVLLPLILLGACGSGSGLSGVSGGGGGPAASLRVEIGSSLAEGVSLALGLITLDQPGLPFGFNSAAGCPVPSTPTTRTTTTFWMTPTSPSPIPLSQQCGQRRERGGNRRPRSARRRGHHHH